MKAAPKKKSPVSQALAIHGDTQARAGYQALNAFDGSIKATVKPKSSCPFPSN
ncbi:hypothetical protein BH10CYA1_BH10CYA1_02890 [soil metagenome]